MSEREFEGRVIVVTGGASGIGRATCLAAARAGARVGIIDTSEANAQAVLSEIAAMGGQAHSEILDVRDTTATEAAVARIEAALGPITGLVASAGISRPMPAERMSDDSWSAVIDVNLTGLFKSARAVALRMIERGSGSIVFISSVDGMGGHAGRSHYAASKHAVVGLGRSLAIEWGRMGVRVNIVAPGVVDTPLLRANIPADHIHGAMRTRIPLNRLATADDPARVCMFLLSDAASYVTGVVLPVDGGLTAGYFTNWNGADYGSNALLAQGLYGTPPATEVD